MWFMHTDENFGRAQSDDNWDFACVKNVASKKLLGIENKGSLNE